MITILNKLTKAIGCPSIPGHNSKNSNAPGKGMLLLCCIITCLGMTAKAQTGEISYMYDTLSMKHYATAQQYNGTGYAMAGTIFLNLCRNGAIHLLVNSGSSSTSVIYDNFIYDERVVGVHYRDTNDILIVISLDNYLGIGADNSLQILRYPSCERLGISSETKDDFWPMGSIVSPDHKILYICGYTTSNLTSPEHPGYNTAKQAFVLRYELSTAKSVIMFYDWPLTSPLGRDYDMAHRMKYLTVKKDSIWVGGLCNGQNGSAMMNMVIDANTLIPGLDAPLNTSLVSEADSITTSFDFSEDLNGEGSSYVFGNYFYPQSVAAGMYPQPANYNITSVDAATIRPVPGATSQVYFDAFNNAWGTNIVYGNETNTVILSGYQDAENGNSQHPSSDDNVNPFLTEMTLSTSTGNISVNTVQWATMLSTAGTGTTSNPNSFYELGDDLSNLVFGPVTTVRDIYGTSDDIVFNGPVWNQNTNDNLNIKYIRADRSLNPECNTSRCDPKYSEDMVSVSAPATFERLEYGILFKAVCSENLQPDRVLNCAETGYFKGGGANTIAAAGSTEAVVATVYPNPAHDQIRVKLNGRFEAGASVKVMLSDITGKQLSTLYNGIAGRINAAVKLPFLSQGLYNVTVIYNGAKLKSVPLVIN